MSAKILVVGDAILDRYVHCAVDRISPEAPVPVLRVLRREETMGGAGNVANNVIGLGQGCERVFRLSGDWPIKTRYVGPRGHHVVRVDEETTTDMSLQEEQRLSRELTQRLSKNIRVVVVSDYAKGTITESFARTIMNLASSVRALVIVDTKRRDWSIFAGADIFTPNEREWSLVDRQTTPSRAKIVVTLGDRGAELRHASSELIELYPTRSVDVADVVGAGDTFVAALAVAIVENEHRWFDLRQHWRSVINFANRAAGVAVAKHGTAIVKCSELPT